MLGGSETDLTRPVMLRLSETGELRQLANGGVVAVEMIPVVSSNVGKVGYDASAQVLHVQYLNNRTYVYSDVPEAVFQELLSAPSTGSFLNRVVKGTYAYHEI
jgi:hypothetical protein